MARIVIEDAVLFILVFYVISSVIFSMPIFDSMFPGQRYNSTSMSMEPYDRTTASILGDTSEVNDTMAKYNNLTIIDPNAMINPLAIVQMVGAYVGMLTGAVSSTMLFYILKLFMGEQLARIITFILNLMIFIVCVRVLTGRIRWD